MKKILHLVWLILGCFFLFMGCHPENFPEKSLQVSENGRYLEYSDGTPFLYLGCTAWELFHALNREEATLYLQNRAEKGFTYSGDTHPLILVIPTQFVRSLA